MLPAVILRYTVFVCMIVLFFGFSILRIVDTRSTLVQEKNCPKFYYCQYKAFIKYKINPAPDGHRCGICPTYYQKMCAFDSRSNETFIFDNHCIMDLYNCMHGTNFAPMYYEECLFFGNFAYVHGIRYEDEDYDEDHIKIMGAKKNPDFV